jgi:hypothetical protein
VALRGASASASSHPFLFQRNFVVLARGFYEAGLLLDRVSPSGHFLNTPLSAVRLLSLQPYSGEAFQQ